MQNLIELAAYLVIRVLCLVVLSFRVVLVLFSVLLFCLVWCFVLVSLFSAFLVLVLCFAVNSAL